MQQTIELEELYEDETESGGGSAVALIRRVWHWDEDGSPAGEDGMAWVFELRGHRVLSWRPFQDRSEALRAAASHRRTIAKRGVGSRGKPGGN